MKLWILKYPEAKWFSDEMSCMVVRAKGEARSRLLASHASLNEGKLVWLDRNKTSCEELTADGDEQCIVCA